jgi:uncharacterized protein
VQMDQAIPLEQRQQGLALATQMEASENQTRMAAMTAATPPRPTRPATVRPTAVPPSTPGVSYTPPPIAGDPTPAAVTPPPARVTPPRPATATPAAASTGGWRVQLGAFGNRANAQALWSRLSAQLPGAQPVYAAAGSVIRLQAGPYASRAAAEAACAAVRPQACFATAR